VDVDRAEPQRAVQVELHEPSESVSPSTRGIARRVPVPFPIMQEHLDEGTAERLNALSEGHFPGLIGFTVVDVHDDGLTARLPVRPDLLAPNGYLHAATVIGLADTACGYGCRLVLPEGASGFTTIELKSNFLRTVREGALACRARLVHGGRTTQVWDATVTAEESGKTLALFRCKQAVLWPR